MMEAALHHSLLSLHLPRGGGGETRMTRWMVRARVGFRARVRVKRVGVKMWVKVRVNVRVRMWIGTELQAVSFMETFREALGL